MQYRGLDANSSLSKPLQGMDLGDCMCSQATKHIHRSCCMHIHTLSPHTYMRTYIHVHPALVRYQKQSDANSFLVRWQKRVWSVPVATAHRRTRPDQTGEAQTSALARKSDRKSNGKQDPPVKG